MFGRKKAENEPIAVYCSRCGNGVTDRDAKFCNRCGAELYISGPAPKAAEPEPVVVEEVKLHEKTEKRPGLWLSTDDDPFKGERVDTTTADRLVSGFDTGKLLEGGWISYKGIAETKVRMPSDEIIFEMRTRDRKINQLKYGLSDPNTMFFVHNNIAKMFTRDDSVVFMCSTVYPDIRSGGGHDGHDNFSFYPKLKETPVPPCGPVDIDIKIKQLTDGFRKQKFEGWTMHESFGEASIVVPSVGGYIEFVLATDLTSYNRLKYFRNDLRFVINNVTKMSKKGDLMLFRSEIKGESFYDPPGSNILMVQMK